MQEHENQTGDHSKADFTLISGDFRNVIITAKCIFEVSARNKNGRVVSRKIELEGDNQLPIMIVDRNGERVKRIPMVDSSNLDGYDMGKDPFSGEKYRMTVVFPQGLPSEESIDSIKLVYLDNERSQAYKVDMVETDFDSNIFTGMYDDNTMELHAQIISDEPPVSIASADIRQDIHLNVSLLKINGNIINDSSVMLPLWTDSDMPVKKIQEIVASNMIIPEGSCEPLEQYSNIPDKSRVYIKVIDEEEENDYIEVNISVGDDRTTYLDVVCEKRGDGHFYSEPFYIVGIDHEGNYLNIEGKNYRVIKIKYENASLDKIKITYKLKEVSSKSRRGAYVINAFNFKDISPLSAWWNITSTVNILRDKLGYFVTREESPTVTEILDKNTLSKNSIFYYNGHGTLHERRAAVVDTDYFFDIHAYRPFWNDNLEGFEITPKDIKALELPEYELVFLNACGSGYKSGYKDISFEEAFNTKAYMGWKTSPIAQRIVKYGKLFFEECAKKDNEGKKLNVYDSAYRVIDEFDGLINENLYVNDGAKGLILGE